MNCLECQSKECKSAAKDCNLLREESINEYHNNDHLQTYESADRLVADGLAGTLSRVEELVLFINNQGYKNVAIAYCYSMEKEALLLKRIMNKNNIKAASFRCTINGIKEKELLKNNSHSVNCNPIGQAMSINKSRADFVIEMGLCLGHDVIFHHYLKKPFTVLAVKDRVHNNCPLDYFKRGK